MDFQQQLQALRQQFTDELARRDSQIEALSTTITSLQDQVRNRSETVLRRPIRQLSDPPKFDGSQLHYDTWLAQLQLVLSVDSEAIGDPQAQFAFVYLRLDSGPAALCLELLKHANLTNTYDYHLILDQLDRHNGIENKVQRAKAKLHKLAQTGGFHGFLISFEVTLGEAGGWNWDDERKIDTLRPCLSDYLKRKLQEHDVSGTTPSKYLEFVSLCKRYASQSGFTPAVAHSSGNAPNQHRTLYDHKADKMDISNIEVETPHIHTIDIDEGYPTSRSSSPSTTNDRSRCFRCGSIDHYVSVCPTPPRILSKPSEETKIQSIHPIRPSVRFKPAQLNRMVSNAYSRSDIPVHKQCLQTTDIDLQLAELEREVGILGIDTVLDTLLEHRYDNGIESDGEW